MRALGVAAERKAVGAVLAALCLAAAPALGADAHAPCLTLQKGVADYSAAFQAAGWRQPEPAEWKRGLETLAEAQAAATVRPVIDTDQALAAFIGNAYESYLAAFQHTEVLVKGDAAVSIRLENAGGVRRVYCLIAGPQLPEVETALRAGPPQSVGDVAFAGGPLDPPEGAAELRADMTRAAFDVVGRTRFTGADAIFVTLTLAAP